MERASQRPARCSCQGDGHVGTEDRSLQGPWWQRSDPVSVPQVLKERLESAWNGNQLGMWFYISWDKLKNLHTFSFCKEEALTFFFLFEKY